MLFLNAAIKIQFKQPHTVKKVEKVECYISQINIIKRPKTGLKMGINNDLPDASHTTLHPTSNCNNETWDCSGEQNTTVTLRKQQQRAQSSLTFATVGSKPITSTHIWTCAPGQTRSSHRAGEERREGIWFSHMMVVRISLLPPHHSQLSYLSQPEGFS